SHSSTLLPYTTLFRSIRQSGLKLGVDPMGGTALAVWQALTADAGLNITVVNSSQDPEFAFMPPDHDGRIRMDCSSPAAMANLLKDRKSTRLNSSHVKI